MESSDNLLLQEVQHALNQLQLHATIIDMTLRTEPAFAPARDGWRSRLTEIRDWAHTQTEEIHGFGEAFDPPDSSEDS